MWWLEPVSLVFVIGSLGGCLGGFLALVCSNMRMSRCRKIQLCCGCFVCDNVEANAHWKSHWSDGVPGCSGWAHCEHGLKTWAPFWWAPAQKLLHPDLRHRCFAKWSWRCRSGRSTILQRQNRTQTRPMLCRLQCCHAKEWWWIPISCFWWSGFTSDVYAHRRAYARKPTHTCARLHVLPLPLMYQSNVFLIRIFLVFFMRTDPAWRMEGAWCVGVSGEGTAKAMSSHLEHREPNLHQENH